MEPVKHIHTLEGLRKEKLALELQMKTTRAAMAASAQQTQSKLQSFVTKNYLLPAGAGIAALVALNKIGDGDTHETTIVNKGTVYTHEEEKDGSGALILTALAGLARMAFSMYKQSRMVDRISHRTAEAVLHGEVPPAPVTLDDTLDLTSNPTPPPAATIADAAKRVRNTVEDLRPTKSIIHPTA